MNREDRVVPATDQSLRPAIATLACAAQGNELVAPSGTGRASLFMKTKLVLLVLLVAGMLAGCATADRLNRVHIGMNQEEVIAIMGPPNSKSAQGNIEYLTYYLSNESRPGDQPYSVRLVDGKVESFGRFAQLFDIYNRPVAGSTQASPAYGPTYGSVYPVAANPVGTPGLASEIQRLKTLKDQGILTEDEFQRGKDRLLNAPK